MIENSFPSNDSGNQIKILEYKDSEEIQFLSKNSLRYCLYITFNILTLGFNILFFYWLELHHYLYNEEKDFENATHVLILTKEDTKIILLIEKGSFNLLPLNDQDNFIKSNSDEITSEVAHSNIKQKKLADFLEKQERSNPDDFFRERILENNLDQTMSELNEMNDSNELFNPENQKLIRNKGKINLRFIRFNNRKYYFNDVMNLFIPIETVFESHILKKPNLIQEVYKYGNTEELNEKIESTFDKNLLEISQQAVFVEILVALFHPMNFGIFMLVIICYFCNKMAEAIDFAFYTVFIILFLIIEKKSRINKIKDLTQYKGEVIVRRPVYKNTKKQNSISIKKYTFDKINICDIMPGDIIKIENESTIYFDGVIIKGSCLVDESLLTGETLPVSKISLGKVNNQKIKSENLLYCGSKCLILREKEVYAIVLSTNWNTYKGKIIGSLLYSNSPNSIMKKEILEFIKWCTIGCLFFLVIVIAHDFIHEKIHIKRVLTHIVDVLDTGIQPTVIFIFQVTFVVVGNKLSDRDIHLLNSDKLFEAGRVKTVCFDKTGTLTQSDMKLFGVVLNQDKEFIEENNEESDIPHIPSMSNTQSIHQSIHSNKTKKKFASMPNLYFETKEVKFNQNNSKQEKDDVFFSFAVMSCCHDIHYINEKLMGDPIETEMFKFTKFKYISQDEEPIIEDEFIPDEIITNKEVDPSYRELINSKNLKKAIKQNIDVKRSQLLDKMYKNLPQIQPSKKFLSKYFLDEDFKFRLLKISPFNSVKKRMSVLVFTGDEIFLVMKGASEVLMNLSKKETIPFDTNQLLMSFGQHGIKPLGMCYKKIDLEKYLTSLRQKLPEHFKVFDEIVEKETLGKGISNQTNFIRFLDEKTLSMLLESIEIENEESNMNFLGLLLMRNPLKKSTKKTIKELKFNLIDCKIVTGDNLYTSLNVARYSEIIEEYEDVWMGKFNKTFQNVDWIKFQFKKAKELSSFYFSDDFPDTSDLNKGQFSDLKNVSKITKKSDLRTQKLKFERASHMTKSIMIEESSYRGSNNFDEDLLSRMDELGGSIIMEKQNVTISDLMNMNRKISTCLVIDGKSLDYLLEKASTQEENDFIFSATKVFASTNPDHKKLIVENIKEMGKESFSTVAFVGDGSNDCKALNKANVGLSIGNNESSMSSALVTSSEEIDKILDVIELGKFSLNNMFEVFIMNNGLSFVEMTCYLFLIFNDYYFMNWKYVIETLVFTQFAFFITFGDSIGHINRFYPSAGIFNKKMYRIILTQLIVSFLLITIGFLVITNQIFYKYSEEIFVKSKADFVDLEEHFIIDSMLFSILFAFISVGYTLSLYIGYPFKRNVFFEFFFLLYIVILVIFNLVAFIPESFTDSFSVQEFFIYYSRTPFLEYSFIKKWLLFCFIGGLVTYFVGKAIRNYNLSEEADKIKKKVIAQKKKKKMSIYHKKNKESRISQIRVN